MSVNGIGNSGSFATTPTSSSSSSGTSASSGSSFDFDSIMDGDYADAIQPPPTKDIKKQIFQMVTTAFNKDMYKAKQQAIDDENQLKQEDPVAIAQGTVDDDAGFGGGLPGMTTSSS
jgi:hypothetical protein